MKKRLCILVSLVLISLFSIHDVNAQGTFLNDLTMDVFIQEDGSAHIKEIWDMNVYEGTEVYKVFDNLNESKITNLKVLDEKGNQYENIGEWNIDFDKEEKDGKCGLVTKDNGYELCFGIGEYGQRVYTFEYDLSYFVKEYDDYQGINMAFFSESTLEPRKARIVVSSPFQFSEENSKIWAFGYNGSVLFEEGKVIMLANETILENGKMQLLMKIEQPLFTDAYPINDNFESIIEDAKDGSYYDDNEYQQGNSDHYNSFTYNEDSFSPMLAMGIVVVGVGLLAFVIAMLTSTYKSRKYFVFNDRISLKDNKDILMFRDIPCHKNIYEFYHLSKLLGLIGDNDKGGLIAAILLQWVQKGYIEFEKRDEVSFGFIKKEGFTIDLKKEIPCSHPLEEELLSYFRQASGENGSLETKEFERWCGDHYEEIDEWFNRVDSYTINDYQNKNLLKLEKTYHKVVGFKVPQTTDCYDASVREEMEHIIGLKKFLEEMSLINEKEVIEVKLWEEYLIYASILGIADKVQEQIGTLCPTFNQQSQLDTIFTMRMVHMFAYQSMNASLNASQMASASSGFGGGSSFGGGGGGFSGGGGAGVR